MKKWSKLVLIISLGIVVTTLTSTLLLLFMTVGRIEDVQAEHKDTSVLLKEKSGTGVTTGAPLVPEARAIEVAKDWAGPILTQRASDISATQFIGTDLPRDAKNFVLTGESRTFLGGTDKLNNSYWIVTLRGLEGLLAGPTMRDSTYAPKTELHVLIDASTFEAIVAYD
jgi:hypothetical protein